MTNPYLTWHFLERDTDLVLTDIMFLFLGSGNINFLRRVLKTNAPKHSFQIKIASFNPLKD